MEEAWEPEPTAYEEVLNSDADRKQCGKRNVPDENLVQICSQSCMPENEELENKKEREATQRKKETRSLLCRL